MIRRRSFVRRLVHPAVERLEDRRVPALFSAQIALASLNGLNGFAATGAALGDQAGRTVAGLGDVNGDGLDDLLIGAPFADVAGSDSGAAYVVFGRSLGFPPNLQLSALNGSNGFRINGLGAGDQLGRAVAGLGDVNGDGLADLLVGAP
jgi:hypothetical protein